MDIIEMEFRGKAIIRGNTPMYCPLDALEVVKRCKELNREIFGIDSFIVTPHATRPVLEHSIDYSSGSTPKTEDRGHWSDALGFIRQRINQGLVFEIVYEGY